LKLHLGKENIKRLRQNETLITKFYSHVAYSRQVNLLGATKKLKDTFYICTFLLIQKLEEFLMDYLAMNVTNSGVFLPLKQLLTYRTQNGFNVLLPESCLEGETTTNPTRNLVLNFRRSPTGSSIPS
jgi:hypothetical protein